MIIGFVRLYVCSLTSLFSILMDATFNDLTIKTDHSLEMIKIFWQHSKKPVLLVWKVLLVW